MITGRWAVEAVVSLALLFWIEGQTFKYFYMLVCISSRYFLTGSKISVVRYCSMSLIGTRNTSAITSLMWILFSHLPRWSHHRYSRFDLVYGWTLCPRYLLTFTLSHVSSKTSLTAHCALSSHDSCLPAGNWYTNLPSGLPLLINNTWSSRVTIQTQTFINHITILKGKYYLSIHLIWISPCDSRYSFVALKCPLPKNHLCALNGEGWGDWRI